jgi:MFS family permease
MTTWAGPTSRPASRVNPNAVLAVVAGITLFSGASLICGLAQSEGMLLVARGAQGLGGARTSASFILRRRIGSRRRGTPSTRSRTHKRPANGSKVAIRRSIAR